MLKIFCIALLVVYTLQVEAHPATASENTEDSSPMSMDTEPAFQNENEVEFTEMSNENEYANEQGLSPATQYRQRIFFVCPSGQALFRLRSIHNNGQEDRTWQFDCRQASTAALTSCMWTRSNYYDEPLIGGCSDGFVATGFRSLFYNAGARDRQFSVKCCRPVGYRVSQCTISRYINNWDALMDYSAPIGQVIAGIYSHHENSREDRRYVVKICRAQC